PTQIGAGSDWRSVHAGVSQVCAVRDTGTLWCWGFNRYGTVSQTDIGGSVLTPRMYGSDHNWIDGALSYVLACFRKSDDSLWCWGDNRLAWLPASDVTVLSPTRIDVW